MMNTTNVATLTNGQIWLYVDSVQMRRGYADRMAAHKRVSDLFRAAKVPANHPAWAKLHEAYLECWEAHHDA